MIELAYIHIQGNTDETVFKFQPLGDKSIFLEFAIGIFWIVKRDAASDTALKYFILFKWMLTIRFFSLVILHYPLM